MKIRSFLFVILTVAGLVRANTIDLRGPGGLFGPTDTYGRLSHQIEYQEIDAGNGFEIPLRFIFQSSAQMESPYGWSGWRVPVIESTAAALGTNQVEVQLLCGKRLFLKVNTSNEPQQDPGGGSGIVGEPSGGGSSSGGSSGGSGGGSSSGGAGAAASGPGVWAGTAEPNEGASPDGEWTVVKDVHPNTEIVTYTITRWDGWEMVYREGRLIRLTSDRGQAVEWQYNGPDGCLSQIVSTPLNAVLLQVNYAGSGAVSSIEVNGDSYVVNISSELLMDITHPDGTVDSFGYGNYSPSNLATFYGFSNPHGGDASLVHTDRYQVSREFYWNPANLLLARDDVWSYFFTYPEASNLAPGSNLKAQSSGGPPSPPNGGGPGASGSDSGGDDSSGGDSGSSSGGSAEIPGGSPDQPDTSGPDAPGGIYDSRRIARSSSPDVTRTRIATSETESIKFSGADDSTRTITRGGHSRRITESRSFGPTYGKVTKVEVRRDGQWETVRYLAYDTLTGRVIRVTDANLQDTVYTYTDHSGAPTVAPPHTKTITDATNRPRVYEYDVRGNLVRRTKGGVTRRYEYDSRDRLEKVRNNANAIVAEYGYNNNDRVTSRKDAAGNTTSFTYLDRYGESLLEKVILPSDDGPAGEFSAKFDYDGKGNLTAFTDASDETWDFTPNPENLTERITDPLDHETDFTYDARANLTQIEDALDQVTEAGYNDLDLIDTVINALEHSSDYTSNAAYQLTGLSDNREKDYGFDYDSNQFRDELEFPDATKITADYGVDGRLEVWTSRGGGTYTVTKRDDAGRIEEATSTYDGFSRDVTFGYNPGGRLDSATATVGSTVVTQSFDYDSEGRADSFTQGTRTAGLTYDPNGRLETITYPAGFTVTYVYNADGQLDQIRMGTDLLVQYHYDDAGRLDWREDTNGVRVEYGFDTLSRTDSIAVTRTGHGLLWFAEYGYDALGNRAFTTRTKATANSPATGDVYRYDATGQLTGVKYYAQNPQDRYDLAVSVGNDAQYDYDAAGNRTAATEGSSTGSYAVNDLNQYTMTPGSAVPGYNSRGDLVDFNTASASDWQFGYDAEGHLVTATYGTNDPIRYHYDAFGERVAKQDGTDFEWYLNVGSEMLEAFDATTVSATSYIYASGIDQPVAQVDDSGNVEFLYQDVLGNVVLVVNEAGIALEGYRYNVWGSVTATDLLFGNPVSSPRSRFLFTGREADRKTGLYHYRTRAYSPQIGRFMQMDSIDFGGGDLNLYRYVANNPVNLTDALGLSSDNYVPDTSGKHGGPHVDRYSGSNNVGRYNKDGSGIPHKGRNPPKIPKSDWKKFLKAAGRLPMLNLLLDSLLTPSHGLTPLYDDCGNFIGYGA